MWNCLISFGSVRLLLYFTCWEPWWLCREQRWSWLCCKPHHPYCFCWCRCSYLPFSLCVKIYTGRPDLAILLNFQIFLTRTKHQDMWLELWCRRWSSRLAFYVGAYSWWFSNAWANKELGSSVELPMKLLSTANPASGHWEVELFLVSAVFCILYLPWHFYLQATGI